MAWLQGVSTLRAGPDSAAIEMPNEVKEGLLKFYSEAVLRVGVSDSQPGGGRDQDATEARDEVDGAESVGVEGGDADPVDNDVPRKLAAQVLDEVVLDAPLGRARHAPLDVALQQQIMNQLMSSLRIGSFASFGPFSMHSTSV